MLQINTGKLYARGVGRTNQLMGVLYSNVQLPYERAIVTGAGTLRSAGSGPGDLALAYELEERIEATDRRVGGLVSHTVSPFLDDFAVVASFGLGGVFSREPEVVRFLTGGRPGFSALRAPASFVAGFFNPSIYITVEQADTFVEFVRSLLALERRSYLGAMLAMRTFVAGLHRIPDDLALAYTLMVSSVESLAQDFDGFCPDWSDVADVADEKRHAIDAALAYIDAPQADKVRAAILSKEHVALARRYRAFAQSHIDGDYFRQPDTGAHPLARFELEAALRQSYDLRSAYIHRLRSLPDAMSLPHNHWETTSVERRPTLTFQGLYRLTRHVIKSFIATRPKVDEECYDYTREQAGVVSVEMAPQYWVWQSLIDTAQARRRLEGLLEMAASVIGREPDAKLVDLRPMLADVERLLPQAARVHRPALLALHFFFNWLVGPHQQTSGLLAFLKKHERETFEPSVDSVIVATVVDGHDEWSLQDHRAVLELYFNDRTRAKGLHAPRLFEAAACLSLAEKCRTARELSEARLWVARAFEAHPAHIGLRGFEQHYNEREPIDWRTILLPKDPQNTESTSPSNSGPDAQLSSTAS